MKYKKTTWLDQAQLDDYPGNAKEHDDVALDESVTVNDQFRAVLARQKEDGRFELLAGHGTTAALRRAEKGKIRVEIIEASDEEALNIVLADNEIGRRAGYDQEKLLALLKQSDGAEISFTGTGFTVEDYDDLLAKLAKAVNTPLPHAEGGDTTWGSASLGELRDRYADKGTRTVAFDLSIPVFEWLVEQFEVLREARSVDSNADLIIRLVEEASGTQSPPPGPEDADSDYAADGLDLQERDGQAYDPIAEAMNREEA